MYVSEATCKGLCFGIAPVESKTPHSPDVLGPHHQEELSNPAGLQHANVVAGELCPCQPCGVGGVVRRYNDARRAVIDDHFHAVLGHLSAFLHHGLKFHVLMALRTDRFATMWLMVMIASHHTLALRTFPNPRAVNNRPLPHQLFKLPKNRLASGDGGNIGLGRGLHSSIHHLAPSCCCSLMFCIHWLQKLQMSACIFGRTFHLPSSTVAASWSIPKPSCRYEIG